MRKKRFKKHIAVFVATALLVSIMPSSIRFGTKLKASAATSTMQEVVEQSPVSYDLSDGNYLLSGDCTVYDSVGNVVEVSADTPILSSPGDYTILTVANDVTYSRLVLLYYVGDVDLNGTSWETSDASLLSEMLQGVSVKYQVGSAAEYAADIDNDQCVGVKDLELLQEVIDTTPTELMADISTHNGAPAERGILNNGEYVLYTKKGTMTCSSDRFTNLPIYLKNLHYVRNSNFQGIKATARRDCYFYVLGVQSVAEELQQEGFVQVARYDAGTLATDYSHPNHPTTKEWFLMEKWVEAGEKVSFGENAWGTLMSSLVKIELDQPSDPTERMLHKYHVSAVTYDYLGGDEVMPIVGFYGPYYGPLDNNKRYNFLTDEIYQKIQECGINLINYSWNSVGDTYSDTYLYQAMALGEKYGIGYYVQDYRLNPELSTEARLGNAAAENLEEGSVNEPTLEDVAEMIGKYSYFESYLGTHVKDEPYLNQYDDYKESSVKVYNSQLKFYDWTATLLNSFANNIGFMNSIAPSAEYMYYSTSFKAGLTELATKIGAKLFSHTSYPFSGGWNLTDESADTKVVYNGTKTAFEHWAYYYQGLWDSRSAALEHDVAFWAYTAAGGDWRDNVTNEETDDTKLPTEAEVYWDVNHKLAFGAKGIEWFPLMQPWYFSLEGDGTDADRNGLIGIDGTETPFYYYAKNINQHIAAIDNVLMKSTSTGIMATGTRTKKKVLSGAMSGDTLITSTEMLEGISGGGEFGAIVGCFDYKDTEAFYVVNDSLEQTQNIVLNFADTYRYRFVQDSKTYQGTGDTLALSIGTGEGVLVVLEEQQDIYYTDKANRMAELVVTGVAGTAQELKLLLEDDKEVFAGIEEVTLEAYSDINACVVFKNGIKADARISWKDSRLICEVDGLSEGDTVTVGGVVYLTGGEQKGRLLSIKSHDFTYHGGTWNLKHDYRAHICVDCGAREEGYTEENGYFSVAAYKGEDAIEKYPSKDGMLFAGWYTDATCEVTYKDSEGVAYAKFVDEGVLTALAQIPIDTTYDTDKTKMRLVSTVDSDMYQSIGFIISVEGSSKGATTISSKNVYKKIVANEGGVAFTKTPTDINAASKYFFTYTITDIASQRFNTKIYVTPYWVTLDGTKVLGAKAIKTVNDGIKVNAGEDLDVGGDNGSIEVKPW